MREMLRLIDRERQGLEQEELFRWLADSSVDGGSRLSFAPAMFSYLMGFKDTLNILRRPAPESKLDRYINAYCAEDADHWRWYLQDLHTLGYGLSALGADFPSFCNRAFGPDTEVNRSTIFRLAHYAAQARTDPLLALLLITTFEATGIVFIGHTRKAAQALGLDDDLSYFGRVHYEEEFGHSVKADSLAAYDLSPESRAIAAESIPLVFGDYRAMFQCWREHVGAYHPISV
jgi:hypothetical protein